MPPVVSLDADLTFSIDEPSREDTPASSASGTIRARGAHIEIRSDAVASMFARSSIATLRQVAAGLARQRLTLAVAGPRGPVVTIGAVRGRWLHRLLTRSPHVRVDDLRQAASIARRRRRTGASTGAASLAALLPPATLFPIAPMARRRPRRVTTTHDPLGGGRPRLLFSRPPAPWPGDVQRVFYLPRGVTTIGSGENVDLRLDGLDDVHAEIRRNDEDEYVLVPRLRGATSTVGGRHVDEQVLRTGSRIQLGSWRMSYFREEFADHGRPHGGRIGGELGLNTPQARPTYQHPDPAEGEVPRR